MAQMKIDQEEAQKEADKALSDLEQQKTQENAALEQKHAQDMYATERKHIEQMTGLREELRKLKEFNDRCAQDIKTELIVISQKETDVKRRKLS